MEKVKIVFGTEVDSNERLLVTWWEEESDVDLGEFEATVNESGALTLRLSNYAIPERNVVGNVTYLSLGKREREFLSLWLAKVSLSEWDG